MVGALTTAHETFCDDAPELVTLAAAIRVRSPWPKRDDNGALFNCQPHPVTDLATEGVDYQRWHSDDQLTARSLQDCEGLGDASPVG